MVDPHADYLDECTPEARERLLMVRETLESAVPGTERIFSYRLPALRKGRMVIWFASFTHHIGMYPPVKSPPDLVEELAPYAGPKGNLVFPHKSDLPLELIGRAGAALHVQSLR
jgi:uncharacterized protein YdhG (YjbR/CyaY superfamily)